MRGSGRGKEVEVGGRAVLIMGSRKGEGWDGRDRQDFFITKA